MRLSKEHKTVLFGNVDLLRFCKTSAIDLNKLKECNIEEMGHGVYVFTLSKNDKPLSNQLLPLDIDLMTQPDIVLIATVNNDKLEINTTTYTQRILTIN